MSIAKLILARAIIFLGIAIAVLAIVGFIGGSIYLSVVDPTFRPVAIIIASAAAFFGFLIALMWAKEYVARYKIVNRPK